VSPAKPAGYSGTPLPKKLGIKAGSVLALLAAPPDFDDTLGVLPEGVRVSRRAQGKADVIVLFAGSLRDLDRRFDGARAAMSEGARLWIPWPKKASGVETDLTQSDVRRTDLDHGLVDYKIGALDATWSGLCFARRAKQR
jgi:hypothetical protein